MTARSTLTRKKKMGYAFGIATDSLFYNMFYTYYLTFLNEIVGIEPKYSAVVIFISILWDAVTDPIIGNYTDRVGVDKRRLMKKSIIPLAIVFIVAWTSVGAGFSSQTFKILFYTALSMLIWLFYTMYTIPYYAVVAELTDDYDERTAIRSSSSLVNALCVGVGNILPALVPTVAVLLTEKYQNNAYAVIAMVMSVLGVVAGFVCCKSLSGVYTPKKTVPGVTYEKKGISDIFKSFASILKMRSARILLAFVFLFLAGSSMLQSNLTYMVVDCIGINYDTGIAIVIGVLVVAMAVTVPIVEKVAKATDRRTACIIFLSVTVVGEIIMKIVGLDASLGGFKIMSVLAPVFLGVGTGTFWTLFYPMTYDLVELDEYHSGERRESIITAFPQLIQKFGSAFGILMAGQFLSIYGYDSSADAAGNEALMKITTDPHILDGMENISTLFPAILIGASVIMLIVYPFTRKAFEQLTTVLEHKRKNEEYDDSELKKLI